MEGGGAPAAAVTAEEAVQALVNYLVLPFLPLRAHPVETPKTHQEEVVAKKMYAVVVLYNYYHRKQFPQLEYLGFEAFCKLAVIAQPSLLTYMKFIHRCKEGSGDMDNLLSITERMIMDACNICSSLDASKDAPNIESWPVSKIAVFLIDPKKEKCLLQLCTITQGVWSLVENNLDTDFDNIVDGQQMKSLTTKTERVPGESSGNNEINDKLRQLAFSAVTEKTGIKQSNLSVLEHHMTYSLSQEKMTTRLYIMMYTESANVEFMEAPVKDVLNSLRGPLFKEDLTPEVTSVVKYYNLLPYNRILSDWLSRETPHGGSLHVVREQADVDEKYLLEPGKNHSMEGVDTNDESDRNGQTANIFCNKPIVIDNETIYKKGDDSSLNGAGCRSPIITNDSSMELDALPTMGFQAMNDIAFCKPSRIAVDSSIGIWGNKEKMIQGAVKKTNSIDGSYMSKKADFSALNHHQQQAPHVGDIKNGKNNNSEVHIDRRGMTSNRIDANVAMNGSKEKAVMADSIEKLHNTESIDGEPLGSTAASNAVQDSTPHDLPLTPNQFVSEDHARFQPVTTPKKNDLLQSSLQLLYTKLDELCQRHRLLGDEVAQCEMNIQKILNGGEENLMSIVKLIIEACNDMCSTQSRGSASLCFGERASSQQIKRKRLSEAIFSLQSPCQELDSICRENTWVLPRYRMLPSFSDGKFQANLTIQGMDFESTVSGDLRNSPREARESAASHMLNKLCNMAGQAR